MLFGLSDVVAAAALTAIGTVLVAVVGGAVALIQMLFTQRKMAKDIKTNHGKKPFEYLEMVAEVHESVVEVKELVQIQAVQMDVLTQQLAEHTVADAVNFAALQQSIAAVGGNGTVPPVG